MTDRPFDKGGYLPGSGTVEVTLTVFDCFIAASDFRARRLVCCRRDAEHLAVMHPSRPAHTPKETP